MSGTVKKSSRSRWVLSPLPCFFSQNQNNNKSETMQSVMIHKFNVFRKYITQYHLNDMIFSTLPVAKVAVNSLIPKEFIKLYCLFHSSHEFQMH